MQEKDITGILKKVEELKALFAFSARLLPFLEDMLVFVQEMAPMLNDMNKSILESSARMPVAAHQLDKVTSATEIATQEMLDRVDAMLSKMDDLNEVFSQVNSRLKAEQEAVAGIAGAVEQLLKLPEAKASLSKLVEDEQARKLCMKVKEIVDEFMGSRLDESIAGKVEQLIQDSQSDAYEIMNALQVQDITTQQIEGAHAVMRSVHERLSNLLMKYTDAAPPEAIRKERAFDADASFVDAEGRQEIADELQKAIAGESAEESGSAEAAAGEAEAEAEKAEEEDLTGAVGDQAEIDAMFSAETGKDEEEVAGEAEAEAEKAEEEDLTGAVGDQAEIDAMFSAETGKDEEAVAEKAEEEDLTGAVGGQAE
ncbi:MAG: hypothetical protein U9P14_02675, partial [Gemmatimonadota bacterium]|nr:hypothetical protein [Gemmatimonadota bacterium]